MLDDDDDAFFNGVPPPSPGCLWMPLPPPPEKLGTIRLSKSGDHAEVGVCTLLFVFFLLFFVPLDFGEISIFL